MLEVEGLIQGFAITFLNWQSLGYNKSIPKLIREMILCNLNFQNDQSQLPRPLHGACYLLQFMHAAKGFTHAPA